MCDLLGMKKLNTTAYHTQCDRLIENFNHTIRAMTAKHVKQFGVKWDLYTYMYSTSYLHTEPSFTVQLASHHSTCCTVETLGSQRRQF